MCKLSQNRIELWSFGYFCCNSVFSVCWYCNLQWTTGTIFTVYEMEYECWSAKYMYNVSIICIEGNPYFFSIYKIRPCWEIFFHLLAKCDLFMQNSTLLRIFFPTKCKFRPCQKGYCLYFKPKNTLRPNLFGRWWGMP